MQFYISYTALLYLHWRINYFSSFSSFSSSFSCSCSYSFHLFLFFSSFLFSSFLLFFLFHLFFFFFFFFSSSYLLLFFFSFSSFLLFFLLHLFFFFICFSSSSVLLLLLLVTLVSDTQSERTACCNYILFTSTEEMQCCLSDAVSKRPLMLDFILQLVTLLYIIVAIMSCSLRVP